MPTSLSLVLPVKDAGPFIGDTLASLANNVPSPGSGDLELIVIDDGSTDDTTGVIDDFRRRLPMMSVIRHDVPVGLASARNVGLDAATGRYVSYIDGDDWLKPGYLPQLLEAIDGLGVDFLRVDHVQVEGRKRTLHRAPEPRRGVVLDPRAAIGRYDDRGMVDYPYAWAGIYKRSLGDVLRFPDGLHTAEDRPWIWRLHREVGSFGVASLAGLFYRRLVTNSLTQAGDERQLHFFDAYAMVFDQVRDEPDVLPKACRQFLALVVHHVRLARTTRPALREAILDKARALLATLPPEMLQDTMLEPARARVLRPLLPDGVKAFGPGAKPGVMASKPLSAPTPAPTTPPAGSAA